MPKPEVTWDQKLADNVVKAGRAIADYAVQNLPFLIFDQDGNVRWEEAFEKLKEINEDPAKVSNEEIAQALEGLAEGFKTEMLDEVITNLPDWKVRIAVGMGIGASKTLLKMNKRWVKELQQKREKLILTILQHETTLQSYELLKDKPNLTRFITDYVLLKLGVPLVEQKKALVAASPVSPLSDMEK